MPRITLIQLIDYRKWTEEIGFDREGIIQLKQSMIYQKIQSIFWEKNCFTLPFRRDYYIVLSNGVKREDLKEVAKELDQITPYGVRVVSIIHEYPVTALLKASTIIREHRFYYEDGLEDEVVVAHIDLNRVMELTDQTSVYESYLEILSLQYYIAKYVFRLGGIIDYMGGDNMIAIIPRTRYNELIEVLPSNLKIGIGVSHIPRKALELAAKALSMIRQGKSEANYHILYESS